MPQLIINVGASPNDHTGTPLRTAGQMINAMFAEIYGFTFPAANLGSCCGTKYLDLRSAVKKFGVTEQYSSSLFFVSKIVNGTGSGIYTYTIEISKSTSITGNGQVVLSRNMTVGVLKTGWYKFDLSPANGSGLTGDIEIDLDSLTVGQTYTCANWQEGALFAVNTYGAQSTGSGVNPSPINEYDNDFGLDGSQPIYLFSGPTGKTGTIDSIANIVKNITLKNISGNDLSIIQKDGLLIDGMNAITLHSGGYMTIIANSTKFEAIGNGYVQHEV